MFHCIKAKLVFCQLLHSPRAKRLELAHFLAIWSLNRDVVKEEGWEEDVRGLKFFHIFPDRILLGRTFVVMLFLFAKLSDNDKPWVVQAIIITVCGLTIAQCAYFVMSIIFWQDRAVEMPCKVHSILFTS